MAKELVLIVLSCVVQGPLLLGNRVEFKCDNSSVVDYIQRLLRNHCSCIYSDVCGSLQLKIIKPLISKA